MPAHSRLEFLLIDVNGWPEILIYLNLLWLFVFGGVPLLTLSPEDPQPKQGL
jgi:hypothetical protein